MDPHALHSAYRRCGHVCQHPESHAGTAWSWRGPRWWGTVQSLARLGPPELQELHPRLALVRRGHLRAMARGLRPRSCIGQTRSGEFVHELLPDRSSSAKAHGSGAMPRDPLRVGPILAPSVTPSRLDSCPCRLGCAAQRSTQLANRRWLTQTGWTGIPPTSPPSGNVQRKPPQRPRLMRRTPGRPRGLGAHCAALVLAVPLCCCRPWRRRDWL